MMSRFDKSLLAELRAAGMHSEADRFERALQLAISNPARARRDRQRWVTVRHEYANEDGSVDFEDEEKSQWENDAPYLTAEHDADARVQAALELADRAHRGEGRKLGEGNFGVAYQVDDQGGERVVVKFPQAKDIHGRPWSHVQQVENLMHEAGVANELGEAGFTIVPQIIYVTLHDGTPALVREYGDPVKTLTVKEFAEVEDALVAVEQLGWRVEDSIDLYRRHDGSLFVGDVGFWRPAPILDPSRRREKSWMDKTTSLSHLLQGLAESTLGRQFARVPTLPSLRLTAEDVLKNLKDNQRAGSLFLDISLKMLVEAVEKRRGLGLPIPTAIQEVLTKAQAVSGGDPDAPGYVERSD